MRFFIFWAVNRKYAAFRHSALFDFYEITYRLIDRFDINERVRKFLYYPLEIGNLMRIYDTDKHFLIVVLINADTVKARCGVLEGVSDFVLEFVALVGYDSKFAGVFKTRNNSVADKARNERI